MKNVFTDTIEFLVIENSLKTKDIQKKKVTYLDLLNSLNVDANMNNTGEGAGETGQIGEKGAREMSVQEKRMQGYREYWTTGWHGKSGLDGENGIPGPIGDTGSKGKKGEKGILGKYGEKDCVVNMVKLETMVKLEFMDLWDQKVGLVKLDY